MSSSIEKTVLKCIVLSICVKHVTGTTINTFSFLLVHKYINTFTKIYKNILLQIENYWQNPWYFLKYFSCITFSSHIKFIKLTTTRTFWVQNNNAHVILHSLISLCSSKNILGLFTRHTFSVSLNVNFLTDCIFILQSMNSDLFRG